MKKYLFEFTLNGVPMRVHWSILLLLFNLIPARSNLFLMIASLSGTIILILLHELGHSYYALKNGYRVHYLVAHCLGGYCSHDPCNRTKDELMIAAGGILFQSILIPVALIFFFIIKSYSLDSLLPYGKLLNFLFIYENLTLIFLNLLPLPHLDGYILFRELKLFLLDRKKTPLVNKNSKSIPKTARQQYLEEINAIIKEAWDKADHEKEDE